MARSKKQLRKQAAKHAWPDTEVDESPFAHVTAEIVTRGQFNLGAPQGDEEAQRSRFLASTAGLLVFKGDATPSPMDVPAEGSALAEAIAARVLADAEVHRLREELAALKAAPATPTDPASGEQSAQALADLRARADTARDEADSQIRSLRDELAAVKATLAEQDAALARATQANQSETD